MHRHQRTRSPGPAAALAALLLAGACTTTLEGAASFPEAVRLYRLSDDKKALAVAVDERGRRVWGVMFGSLRQESANEKALEECTRNAARAGVRTTCHLFAIGDDQAPATVGACKEGRISAKRCALQSSYGW